MPKGVYERDSAEDRFWKFVDVLEDDKCWLWKGSVDSDGYGWFSWMRGDKKRNLHAHRYSLMMKLNNFDLPSTTLTRHTCDERSCVNPNHLIPGSAQENSADMVARNRQAVGEKNGQSIISDAIAQEIIDKHKKEVIKKPYGVLERLAEEYKIPKQMVYRLVSGQTRKHLIR
jgi:hypothetical protein